MKKEIENINIIIATDCGSTTTKSILIQNINGEYRLTHRGEAPTTVEAPFEDVTRGVLNAITELEELSGRTFLDGEKILPTTPDGNNGSDIYISTSSAGGGLQMGQTVGESDAKLYRPKSNPVTPQDLMATVFHVLGMDHRLQFSDQGGRPVYMIEDGEPIKSLI